MFPSGIRAHADEGSVGAWLRCLEMAALLLQQLRSARLLPAAAALDLTVAGLLPSIIVPAVQHANSAAVRCDRA